ncbi:MAG: deoxyguanosinetriphosphate triphosphohydrolase [Candidatus Hydrogenedentes bacterium]|nr:deoxyguanosinetriphosphate triphosphohydrolase [Candidatus Hydrogenedentota bacterium]
MVIREQLEQREYDLLRPYAVHVRESRGRMMPEQEDPYRTAFQRDRDRILHTKAFRRLKHKTQVFLRPQDDHYRTRLTHTLEVSQIARTLARALFLNEDLVEAIALGHDLGHAPFGHAGESVLNELYAPGFKHYEQSLRVVDLLEKRHDKAGLNLSAEVRDGILRHSAGKCLLYGKQPEPVMIAESRIVSISDAIAYISHDIDDAIRAGVITEASLPANAASRLGTDSSDRIDAMVVGVIEGSPDGIIGIMPDVCSAMAELRDYLYHEVYPCEAIESEIRNARRIIRELYLYLIEHPTDDIIKGNDEDSSERHTVDIVAGMTDEYAMRLHRTLLQPRSWAL